MSKFEINNKIVGAFQLTSDVATGKSSIPKWAKDAAINNQINICYIGNNMVCGYIKRNNKEQRLVLLGDWIVIDEHKELSVVGNNQFLKNYTEIICYTLSKKH